MMIQGIDIIMECKPFPCVISGTKDRSGPVRAGAGRAPANYELKCQFRCVVPFLSQMWKIASAP